MWWGIIDAEAGRPSNSDGQPAKLNGISQSLERRLKIQIKSGENPVGLHLFNSEIIVKSYFGLRLVETSVFLVCGASALEESYAGDDKPGKDNFLT